MVTIVLLDQNVAVPVPPVTSADYYAEKYNYVYCIFGMNGRQDLIRVFFHCSDLLCPSQK